MERITESAFNVSSLQTTSLVWKFYVTISEDIQEYFFDT